MAAPPGPASSARARPGLYWAAVLVALVALVAGGVVAYLGYSATSGPGGTVRGYYAALQRGDAATALAFGKLPRGPHALLTDRVLRAQQQRAPLSHLEILSTNRAGAAATVTVDYDLGFATGVQHVIDQVPLRRVGDRWRLSAVAVAVTIELSRAGDRATIAGGRVPSGRTLLFPGAVPVRLDTPYLSAAGGAVSFTSGGRVDVGVVVSQVGRSAVVRAVREGLTACLRAGAAGRCPLPSDRYVPGSLRGSLSGSLADAVSLTVAPDPAGVIEVSGTIGFEGSYRKLDFDNVASGHTGTIQLPLSARTYAVTPLRLRWAAPA